MQFVYEQSTLYLDIDFFHYPHGAYKKSFFELRLNERTLEKHSSEGVWMQGQCMGQLSITDQREN